jgi:hypothetical protein
MKPTRLHGGDRFRVLHEGLPDKAGAKVLCHQQADSQVDAEDIRVVPEQGRMECVAEAVATPCVLAVLVFERTQDTETIPGKERE